MDQKRKTRRKKRRDSFTFVYFNAASPGVRERHFDYFLIVDLSFPKLNAIRIW